MNVTVRGLLPVGMKMRDDARWCRVGGTSRGSARSSSAKGSPRAIPAARVGSSLKFGRGTWDVVGEFRDGGRFRANSEIWADLNQLAATSNARAGAIRCSCGSIPTRRRDVQESGQGRPAPRRDHDGEREYYEQLTKSSSGQLLQFIGSSSRL
jgi:putative ABC transport system permease protein